jgi:hypothetical protein
MNLQRTAKLVEEAKQFCEMRRQSELIYGQFEPLVALERTG